MRLYCAPGTISVAVAIALEEAGLAWEPLRLDFGTGEQRQAPYLGINPKGRVPALEVNGAILTETGAILDYIGACAPDAGLLPDDPLQAARMRSVMYYLASTMHVNHAHKLRGHRWADQRTSWADMTAKVPETMTESARFVEDNCLAGAFVLGDRLSIADPYLFVVCTWLPADGVDPEQFPRIKAFVRAMEARASVRAVRAGGLLS